MNKHVFLSTGEIKDDYEREWSQIQHLYNTHEDMQLADDCTAADNSGTN